MDIERLMYNNLEEDAEIEKKGKKISGIFTIEIIIASGDKIRLHNIIYIPTLNLSLFSIKRYMKYARCYEH